MIDFATMPSVPFPVLTLLALTLLLVRALFPAHQRHRGTLYFLITCILLIAVTTLRWEFNLASLRHLQPFLAMLLPPVVWHSFISMAPVNRRRYLIQLLAPASLSLCIRIVWPASTDWLLILLFTGYGCSLLSFARQGGRRLTLCRGELEQTKRMASLAGCFLCLSAIADLLILFDFGMTGGKLAPSIIAIAQAMLLPFIGAAILAAGKHVALAETGAKVAPARPVIVEDEAANTFNALEKMVRDSQIYLNPDLTLALLARKTGIPARQLSSSVNAVSAGNLSQWINGFRIERAKTLLVSTALPVTEIMLESGFTTKSNFNREFQRVVGASPTAFRQQQRENLTTHSEMR
ncbi:MULTISPECIES: helix-turn-helix domain-containing protein [Leclercia]|uniref:helix-turn-helix domain-containing protein n=1 Tax=Leclercia TaxID=83654 RepID=UPI00265B335E|nr:MULTISPECIES: AraC family transcriptional regulator [Leclercia]MCG1031431.1 helix-turn-helix transcriptional regulator [Bacillus amyloliquefaciens]WNY88246.1 AraC family transcriptional regulator [Leclercia adecarboxylata]